MIRKLHQSQIVIHKDLATDIKEIFELIQILRFPVRKVIPIVRYNWDDIASLMDDNSSDFNYRPVSGGRNLSNHALGRAVDLNPLENPYIKGAVVLPHVSFMNPKYPEHL